MQQQQKKKHLVCAMAYFITGCFSIDCLKSLLPHVGYVLDIKKKAMELETEGDQLKRFREDLQSQVHRATADGIMVLNNEQEVKGWLEDDARKAIDAAEKYVTQAREMMGNHSFLSRWTVKVWDCYQLRNHIAETTESVVKIKNSKPVLATIPHLPEPVLPYPATAIKKDTSADRTMEKVWSCLLSNEYRKIGVWGMGGIGKTNIIKNIIKKLEGTNHFDHVICVVVSRDWNNNMSKLRNDIAKEINLNLKEGSQDRAPRLLCNKLKDKKFLLVLDDIWEKIDLEELGVPCPSENNGSKVALTTRQRGICNDMETDIEIMVELLSDDESWDLFCEKAGGSIPSSVEDVARLVCKECCGLPLAIITVGSAMRKQDQMSQWNRALRHLKDELNYNIRGTKENVVYTHLRFSYDMLSNDTLRSCFLYASLFPEDHAIDVEELIEYWIMEGYVGRGKNQKDAVEDGHHCLIELVDSCLLFQERDVYTYEVKMHDVIRDMAIKITSESTEKGKRFWVKAGVLQQEEFEVETQELKTKDKISLMWNSKIRWLRGNPNIPETSTLLLRGNLELCKIDEGFFQCMTSLSILDLSWAGIECLPGSLCKLVSLTALILSNCKKLKSIDPVVGLVKLRFLNLSWSGIVELPQDMGQLIQLIVLDISFTFDLKNFPSGIIAGLSRLEILDTIGCDYFSQPHSIPGLIVIMEEIKNLKCLSFLSFHFTDSELFYMLGTVYNWKNLRGFILEFGMDSSGIYLPSSFRQENKCLSISNVMDFLMNDVDGSIKHTNTLVIKSDPRLRSVSQLGTKNLVNIKECIVDKCKGLEYFITSQEAEENTFPWLEILNLEYLPKLRTIWYGHVTNGSFQRIRRIILNLCYQLTHLFSTDMICQLHCLEEMYISECYNLDIIIQGDVGHGSHVLPKLREIRLNTLDKLTKLWEGDLSLPSLKYLKVEDCDSLKLPQVAPDVQVNIVE